MRLAGNHDAGNADGRRAAAFTLIEVMVAVFIFFTALFAILELVSQGLESARRLGQNTAHASMVAAELSLTNKLEEGLSHGDFGDLFPGYTWERDIYLISTNGLFQVDIVVMRQGYQKKYDSKMSIYLYRPESIVGAGGGLGRFRR